MNISSSTPQAQYQQAQTDAERREGVGVCCAVTSVFAGFGGFMAGLVVGCEVTSCCHTPANATLQLWPKIIGYGVAGSVVGLVGVGLCCASGTIPCCLYRMCRDSRNITVTSETVSAIKEAHPQVVTTQPDSQYSAEPSPPPYSAEPSPPPYSAHYSAGQPPYQELLSDRELLVISNEWAEG